MITIIVKIKIIICIKWLVPSKPKKKKVISFFLRKYLNNVYINSHLGQRKKFQGLHWVTVIASIYLELQCVRLYERFCKCDLI